MIGLVLAAVLRYGVHESRLHGVGLHRWAA